MVSQKRLLIVDDDKIHRTIYFTISDRLGYRVSLAATPDEAQDCLLESRYDAVVLDLVLGEASGAEVLSAIAALPYKPRVLLVTAAAESLVTATLELGRSLGLELFGPVRKPLNVVTFRTVLRSMEIAANEAAPRGRLRVIG